MNEDPIVAEVRQRRSELLRTSGGTLEELVQFLRDQEDKSGRTPIRLEPKVPASPRAG